MNFSVPGRQMGRAAWERLTIRCGAPRCAFWLKLNPAILTRFRGIQFQGRWYHEAGCLTEGLELAVRRLLPSTIPRRPRRHRLPLGLLLVQRGAITPQELREGLRLQQQSGTGKLGYWLRQFTALQEEEICAALAQQWCCPVFPLPSSALPPIGAARLPYPLLAAAKAIPVFCSSDKRQTYIAFSELVDHRLLFAVEKILDCQTFPCIARESMIQEALERVRQVTAAREICFDTVQEPTEIAATISSYATQLDVREMKLVSVCAFLWAALFRGSARRDLLFHFPDPANHGYPWIARIKAMTQTDDRAEEGIVRSARSA